MRIQSIDPQVNILAEDAKTSQKEITNEPHNTVAAAASGDPEGQAPQYEQPTKKKKQSPISPLEQKLLHLVTLAKKTDQKHQTKSRSLARKLLIYTEIGNFEFSYELLGKQLDLLG